MTDLHFSVLDIAAEPYAVVPTLIARLRIEERTGAVVHAVALRTQVRIEAQKRRYDEAEASGLLDLFGPRKRWVDTLKPFLWMHTTATVQGFTGSTEVELVLPCTYDLEVAGAKYLHALRDGEIPLVLLFSGTIFSRGATGFEVEQIPWDKEASYRLPVRVWREMMDRHFPNGGWLRLDRDTIDALSHFKGSRGLISWDETVAALLAEVGEVAR